MGVAIPDIHDKASVYSLDLTNLKVNNVVINKGDINFSFNNGLLILSIKNVEIDIVGDSHIVAVWIIDAKGQMSVKVQGISATIALKPEFNQGKLQFQASQISVNTGNIDISITGNIGAKILNLFTGFITSTVQDIIKSTAEDEVNKTVIPLINQMLATLAYDYPIPGSPFSVHAEPSEDLQSQNGAVSQNLQGYLYNTNE